MIQKRSIHYKTVECKDFYLLPITAQALYFHLLMKSDDDGFVDNPREVCRHIGAPYDDLRVLVDAEYLIDFKECEAVAIKAWWKHNSVRKSCHQDTPNADLLAMLDLTDDIYTKPLGSMPYGTAPSVIRAKFTSSKAENCNHSPKQSPQVVSIQPEIDAIQTEIATKQPRIDAIPQVQPVQQSPATEEEQGSGGGIFGWLYRKVDEAFGV